MLLMKPNGHGKQSPIPVSLAYRPGVQGIQTDRLERSKGEENPLGHGSQLEYGDEEVNPTGHK